MRLYVLLWLWSCVALPLCRCQQENIFFFVYLWQQVGCDPFALSGCIQSPGMITGSTVVAVSRCCGVLLSVLAQFGALLGAVDKIPACCPFVPYLGKLCAI